MGNNRRQRILRIMAIVLAVVLLASTLMGSFIYIVWADEKDSVYTKPSNYTKKVDSDEYMRGVWISTIYSLDYPSKLTNSAATLKKDIDEIVANCVEMGMNTMFFQVRPASDALYDSDIFPWSKYISGTQGKAPSEGFDPLEYAVTVAHKAGLELHAWINPYRITQSGEQEYLSMSSGNPAKSTHSQYVIKYGENYYYDPAEPEVRKLIVDGACEIVKKYDVDGIHLDDYFYPGIDFNDAKSFALYGKGWGNIGDWRRNNVNILIKELDEKLHQIDRKLSFGVSPAGIWENQKNHPDGSATSGQAAYSTKYCDALTWIEEGWVDYIMPQIYWETGHVAADYRILLDWWSNAVKGTDVKLYIGMPDYKATGVTDNSSPWYGTVELERQMCLNGADKNVNGEVHFRYRSIIGDSGIKDMYKEWYTGVMRSEIPDLNNNVSEVIDNFGNSMNKVEKLFNILRSLFM